MDKLQEYSMFAMLLCVYMVNMKPPQDISLDGNLWLLLFNQLAFLFNVSMPVILFLYSKEVTLKFNNFKSNLKRKV